MVIDPADAARPHLAKSDLLVLDPSGSVKARLAARGIGFTEVTNFATLPAKARVVLVGPKALTPEQSTSPKWLELAADGTRVIVLEQEHPLHYQAIAADLEPTDYVGRVAFAENLEHPVFTGLGQKDFFTWSKDHVVYRNAYKKAAKGCRSLVQCEPELACSAMAECQVNDGLMILCQLVVGEKLAFDPVAQRLFDNTLNYAADYQVSRKRTAWWPTAQSPWARHPLGLGPEVRPRATWGPHWPTASTKSSSRSHARYAEIPGGERELLQAFTDRGGYVMLCGLTPEGLADFDRLVGFDHAIRPFEMERVTLATPNDPLMAGLTARDVVMESSEQVTQWGGDKFMASDVFSYVVDLNDIAPFCKIPGPEYFHNPGAGPAGTIGRGIWSTASLRPIAGSTVLRSPTEKASRSPGPWNCRKRKRSSKYRSCLRRSSIASPRLKLTFDGGDPITLKLAGTPGRQFLPVPPHRARRLGIEVVPVEGKDTASGYRQSPHPRHPSSRFQPAGAADAEPRGNGPLPHGSGRRDPEQPVVAR